MKRKPIIYLVLFLLLLIIFTTNYAFADKTVKDQANYEAGPRKVLKSAGMDVYLLNHKKSHSIDGFLHVPYSRYKYHPVKVHLHKDRDKIISSFSRNYIVIDHDGFEFTIKNAILDHKRHVYVGDAKITGSYIPGPLYSHHIQFNHKGIIKVTDLDHRGEWKLGGFSFTPSQVKWKNGAIEATGILGMKSASAEITIDIGRNGVKVVSLKEPVHCLVKSTSATVNQIKIDKNQVYVSGYSDRHSPGKPHRFKDIPMSPTGEIDTRIPGPPRPPKPIQLSSGETSREMTFQDTGRIIYGMAGLPGEMLVKVANSSMTMRVTSVQKRGDREFYSGYVTLPDPLKRANIVEAEKSGSSANLKNSKIFWQKDRVKIPILGIELTTVDDVSFKEKKITYGDDERTVGCIESPLVGIFKILELNPDAASIYSDGEWTNYTVKPMSLDTIFKAKSGFISPKISTQNPSGGSWKITFTVKQRANDIGFYFDSDCDSINLAPDNGWFNSNLAMGPHLTFEFTNTGYIYVYIETGETCEIPIIPELLEIENPRMKFVRHPGFFTDFWIAADFVNPETKKIFKVEGAFYLDVNGMGSVSGIGKVNTGAALKFDLFRTEVGEVSFDFDGNKRIFTCDGDIEIFKHKLFENAFQLYLKKSAEYLVKGYASIRIYYWTFHIHKPHWRKKHKDINIKYHVKRNGHFGLSFGKYHFHGHHGGGNPSYDGKFTADGVQYDGHMELVNDSAITLTGKTDDMKAGSGNDSVDTTLSISGSMDDTGTVDRGTITTSSMSLVLKPTIPQSNNPVEIDLNLTPKYQKDPQSGQWQTPQKDIQVSFSYTDSKGSSQQYSGKCNFRIYMDQSAMHLDLDLPPKYGGTYSQSFDLSGK